MRFFGIRNAVSCFLLVLLVGCSVIKEVGSPPIYGTDVNVTESEVARVKDFLSRYEHAYETECISCIQSLYIDGTLNDQQRATLKEYFGHVENYRMEIELVGLKHVVDGYQATLHRHDRFVDRLSGAPQHLEVLITTDLVGSKGGQLKISPTRKED